MNRRRLLEWLSGSLAAACAAVMAVPGMRYVLASVRPTKSEGAARRRVTRLTDLPIGRPVSIPITGSRRDAWTTHANETLGNVWFIRRDGDSVEPDKARVDAFGSICPHLRCRVLMDAAGAQFVCPCHRGAFELDGKPVTDKKLGYHNPVPRPLDTYDCHIVADDRGEWWVEVEFPS